MKSIIIQIIIFLIIGTVIGQDDFRESNVQIPWSDFRQILKELKTDTAKIKIQAQLPASFVISDAQYKGKSIEENEFIINSKLTVKVLESKEWVEIPLGRAISIYPDIKVNDHVANVGMKENGMSVVFLQGTGDYNIDYSFKVAHNIASGQSSISFPMPGQTVATLKLQLDKATYSVIGNNRALVMEKEGKNFFYEGGLGSGKKAYITWMQEKSGVSGQNAMVFGQVNTVYSLGADVANVKSQISLNVIHEDIGKFSLKVPTCLNIIDITGHAVATWESADSGNYKNITVYLKYNLRDNATFDLSAEYSYDDTTSQQILPSISIENAARQEGVAGVGVLGNVELKPFDNSNNVLRKDKRELPRWFNDQEDVLFVYQYLSGDYKIALKLTPHGNIPVLDALVSNMNVNSVIRDDGKMVTQLDLTVRNRGEQFLRLKWKPSLQLWSVYCNNKPARPAFDTLNNELLIPVRRTTEESAETNIRLVYLTIQKPFKTFGQQKISYPEINMPVQNINGTFYIPEAIRFLNYKGNLAANATSRKSKWFNSMFLNNVGLIEKQESYSPFIRTLPKEINTKFETKTAFGGGNKRSLSDNFSDFENGGIDVGQISIPVNVNFEGSSISFGNSLIKTGETPTFTFWYHEKLKKIPLVVKIIVNGLILLVSVMITYSLWSEWTNAKTIYGILLPFLFILIINRIFDKVVNLDYFFIIPILILAIILFVIIMHKSVTLGKKVITNMRESKRVMEEIDNDFSLNENPEKESE